MIEPPNLIVNKSYCFLLAFSLADIIFHKFLELYSTLSVAKKIFITNFPFLTDLTNLTDLTPPHPLPPTS